MASYDFPCLLFIIQFLIIVGCMSHYILKHVPPNPYFQWLNLLNPTNLTTAHIHIFNLDIQQRNWCLLTKYPWFILCIYTQFINPDFAGYPLVMWHCYGKLSFSSVIYPLLMIFRSNLSLPGGFVLHSSWLIPTKTTMNPHENHHQ